MLHSMSSAPTNATRRGPPAAPPAVSLVLVHRHHAPVTAVPAYACTARLVATAALSGLLRALPLEMSPALAPVALDVLFAAPTPPS